MSNTYFVVSRGPDYKIATFGSQHTASTACRQRLAKFDRACVEHYQGLLEGAPFGADEFRKCPYGFLTSKPIQGYFPAVLLSGLEAPLAESGPAGDQDLKSKLALANLTAHAVSEREYQHLEAAIHEIRHLNASALQHSELLMQQCGHHGGVLWDINQINADPVARRAFSIYCAAKDMSLALSLHELSRNPAQAGDEVSELEIHKLFYRQREIASEQTRAKGLTIDLAKSNKRLRLSKAFRLIPKILLDNAIKYAERGTRIEVQFVETPQTFRVTVRNQGTLVKQSECSSVFARGYRGANSISVTGGGIGLYLAKLIVEANQGRIEFHATEGERRFRGSYGTTEVRLSFFG